MAPKMNDKPTKFGGQLQATTITLIVLLVVSLVLVILYSREDENGALHGMQNTVNAISSPLGSISATTGNIAATATRSVEDLTASDATMNQLRENNQRLSQMVVELEEYRQEAQRLEGMIGLSDAYGFTTVAARVTGYSADSYNQVITLDCGADAGVRPGVPVMGSTGVIGQVISTTAGTCKVRLITDPQSGVAVLLQSSREEGILYGSVGGTLYLRDVDDNVEVKEGDAVITSGLGGGYFRGLVIGTVAKVEWRAGEATRTIIVTPNNDMTNINEALVVLEMGKTDAASEDSGASASAVAAVAPEALTSGAASGDSESEGEE